MQCTLTKHVFSHCNIAMLVTEHCRYCTYSMLRHPFWPAGFGVFFQFLFRVLEYVINTLLYIQYETSDQSFSVMHSNSTFAPLSLRLARTHPYLNLFYELRNSHQMTVSLIDSTLQRKWRRGVSSYMKTHISTTYWEAKTADELHFSVVQSSMKILYFFCSMIWLNMEA